jgi:hypothetical protein
MTHISDLGETPASAAALPGQLPRTKKQALDALRSLTRPGAIIYAEQLAVLGPRDRLLTFSLADGTVIDHLVARLVELPLEPVPGAEGVLACRATDTGDGVASAFVGVLSRRLYGEVGRLKCMQKRGQRDA